MLTTGVFFARKLLALLLGARAPARTKGSPGSAGRRALAPVTTIPPPICYVESAPRTTRVPGIARFRPSRQASHPSPAASAVDLLCRGRPRTTRIPGIARCCPPRQASHPSPAASAVGCTTDSRTRSQCPSAAGRVGRRSVFNEPDRDITRQAPLLRRMPAPHNPAPCRLLCDGCDHRRPVCRLPSGRRHRSASHRR